MRATSTVVVFSSLLVAASVAAGPADQTGKKAPAASKGSAKATGSASGATTGSASTKTGAAGTTGAGAAGTAGTTGAAGTAGTTGGAGGPAGSAPLDPPVDLASVKPEDMPTAVRMRRLEQKTQALKERAWQLKARVQMLKENMLGGGAGAQAVIEHVSDMGASFRMTKLVYSLDGTQVFVRTDDTAESLYKTKSFDVFSGPIAPGNHTLTALATYRGHGYGVFEYLSKYTFTARGNQAFLAGEGKISKVDCKGFEKGGPTTPLEKRAAVECKVTQIQPERADKDQPAATGPTGGAATTPAPGSATPTPGAAGATVNTSAGATVNTSAGATVNTSAGATVNTSAGATINASGTASGTTATAPAGKPPTTTPTPSATKPVK